MNREKSMKKNEPLGPGRYSVQCID